MPTADQVAKWAGDIEECYPEALADRLRWFQDRLGAGADRLLRLIGCRRRGRPMQQINIQIAASALSLGNCTVVSADSDLSAVPGLTVENWAG